MPKIKSPKQVEEEKIEKNTTYSLKDADRPLNEQEIEAEEKATKFSRMVYRRIPPIPGTLAYLLRNVKGGNESVVEFLRWAQVGETGNRTRFIKNFIILWENMDEFSRRRADIFDHLCRKYSIPLKRFWGVLQEGMFDHNDQITQTALNGAKPQFVERLLALTYDRRNHQDRKLAATAMKLVTDEPLIKIEDKSQHLTVNNQNNIGIPSFSQTIKRSEEVVRQREIDRPKELTEGNNDYIDAEIVKTEDERELEFVKAVREL
jgi:hypothetical protein